MQELRLRITPAQLRGRWRAQAAGTAGTGVFFGGIIGLGGGSGIWWLWALGAVISLNVLIGLYENVAYTRAFTECTPAGVRTRGLAGTRRCPWPHVGGIACQRRAGGVIVIVTTTSGAYFRLGAPVDGISMRDPDLRSKVAQVQQYWRLAAGPSLSPTS